MSATFLKDLEPCEVGDSDTYNRFQVRRAIYSRGDPDAEPLAGGRSDPLRVLIAEDHHALRTTTAKLLRIWGYDVRQACDGSAALAVAATYKPQIVLLDILMPKMNGLEFAAQLRRISGLETCFLVATSGCTDTAIRSHCKAASIDLFLIKPVAASILKTLVTWESDYQMRRQQIQSIQQAKSQRPGGETSTIQQNAMAAVPSGPIPS